MIHSMRACVLRRCARPATVGDRSGALREARLFEALIAEELEITPDRAVVQLAEELRVAAE